MTIEFDPVVINQYLKRRATDFELCQSALTRGDYQSIARVGHMMKGNGESFGFPELSELGDQIEVAALEKNHQLLSQKIERFARWLHSHFPKA